MDDLISNKRQHGHWITYGYSAKCSVCGFCEENLMDNYCMRCGSIMDGASTFEIPVMDLPQIKIIKCDCGFERMMGGQINVSYCPKCGKRIGE